MLGKMLHTLVGYTAAPDGAQLIAYLATIAAIFGLMRWERTRHPRGKWSPILPETPAPLIAQRRLLRFFDSYRGGGP